VHEFWYNSRLLANSILLACSSSHGKGEDLSSNIVGFTLMVTIESKTGIKVLGSRHSDSCNMFCDRIGSPVARPKTADTFESVGLPGSVGAQPHAAVGAFVRFLRSAPPLRELRTPSGTFSDLALGKLTSASPQVPVPTHTSPLTAVGSLGVAKVKGSPPNPGATMMRNLSSTGRPGVDARFGSGSPFVSPGSGPGPALTVGSPPTSLAALSLGSRTAADALEELRGYREMRDFLMRQRGGNLASGQTAV
jgi:hypothetical protein